MFYDGEGVPKNDTEAIKWFRRAADQGHASAQLNLGLAYVKGEGIPRNEVEAYFWLNLAAAQGSENAKQARDLLVQLMTREQISEAQNRSATWKSKGETQ